MELKTYPDPVLRKRSSPLRRITEAELRKLHDMLELMYENEGIGLAGPQVGWNIRVITMDVGGSGTGERIFINPTILHAEGRQEEEEGCLSLPGIRCRVARSDRVTVAAYTLKGEKLELEKEGLAARAWQHEIDHLNGILFIDKIPASAQMAIRHRLDEMENREKR